MANTQETTFKDLQMDERYKKLERTLKMVLLKNADRRSTDNGSTSGWPSISSINGDHLDMSCAAMSVQSSRIGSEVVASSANFRNIQMHKKQYKNPHPNVPTSSENQFPTNKGNIDDSIMMPPPSTPGICFGRTKRFSEENQRIPLLNMPINPGRSNNGFAMSTPACSIAPIPKNTGNSRTNGSTGFQENEKYERNAYEEDVSNSAQRQERIFSRWRVLLNDKGQLIIKGTLECGKIARSKPVIRRLTATSVQSIFKHTYHLQGNLVDERGELPDYVRGKFFSGFPDDWENVYQIWRNFLNDGSRLSFRWPTAVTDSDDDIKSEVTEISYHPKFDKYKKSVSPRKRVRTSEALSAHGSIEENNENLFEANRYSHRSSHNNSSAKTSLGTSGNAPETLSRSQSKCNRNEEAALEENKKSTEAMNGSITTSEGGGMNTLKDIIQEDKLNIIIDNLTNKNCPMEYINKIVEMFDCMKFVVSYQSTGENHSEKNTMISQSKEPLPTPKKKNLSTEENRNNSNTPSTENRLNTLHNPGPKADRYENAASTRGIVESRNREKSYKDQYVRQTRRRLTANDYDSSESENDYYDDIRRSAIQRLSKSQESIRRSRKNNGSYQKSVTSRTSRQYIEPEKSFEESHRARKYVESSVPTSNRHESSLSEEEHVTDRRMKLATPHNRALTSPRKCRPVDEELRRRMDHYDSSISITEDEERYTNKSKAKNTKIDRYDSSVSITEDEQGDFRVNRGRLESLKYYPESNAHPVASNSIRDSDIRGDRKKLEILKYSDSKFRPVEPVDASTNLSRQGTPRKIPALQRPMVADDNRSAQVADHTVQNYNTREVETNNFMMEQKEESAGLSSEIMRSKNPEAIRENEFDRSSESPEMPAPKNKTPQVRKKPIVVSSELIDINLKSHNWQRANSSNENDKNAVNTPRVCIDRLRVNTVSNDAKSIPNSQKTLIDTPLEAGKIAELIIPKSTTKETNTVNVQDGKSSTNKLEKAEKTTDTDKEVPIAKFGSEKNPKPLTAWVPAVVCDDEGDSKYHLVFEGKLLNEAGHVVNRKFVTDFIRRRVSAKLVETINQEFYQLVGDLKDTKHVVPKELVKLCHSGCPARIGHFCDKWKAVTADNNKTPPRDHAHNKSVDCLSVPKSSRGRRILPPLNYWAGERITTKDNMAVYSPGNAQESSIPSSLEKTNEEVSNKKSPKKGNRSIDQNGKQTDVSKANATKRKNTEKVSPTKASMQSPPKSQRMRAGKRRLVKNVQTSSSDSEVDEQTKPTPRKRKTRANGQVLNTENGSTRKTRNSSKNNNTASSQSPENSARGSFEKISELEAKTKLRKRQKIDYDEEPPALPGTSKQCLTRRNAVVTCTHYKNVPFRCDDLSEDQLSTM